MLYKDHKGIIDKKLSEITFQKKECKSKKINN
jgi:hypothetical protein